MTGLVVSVIVGIGTGVLASVASWWWLTHALVPRLSISQNVAKPSEGEYRVKVLNEGRRPVIDIELRAYLVFHTAVPGERFTLLFRTRQQDRLDGRGGDARHDWWTHLRPEGTSMDHLDAVQQHLPSWAYVALSTGRALEFTTLLSSKSDGPFAIRVVVAAQDSFSRAQRVFTQEFSLAAIIPGVFQSGSLEVVPAQTSGGCGA